MTRRRWRIGTGAMAFGFLAAAVAGEPSKPSGADLAGCVRLLGDPDFETREKAFDRLLDWGIEHPEQVLKSLPRAHEDIEVQNRCQEIRDRIPWERRYRKVAAMAGGHADLVAAARDCFPSPTVQSISNLALAAQGRQKVVADMLLALMEGEREPEVQAVVISQLGVLEVKGVSRALIPFFRNRHPSVRHQAAHVVGRLKDEGIAADVLPLIEEDDPAVRQVALIALTQLKDRSTAGPILRLLEKEEDWQVRQSAVHAILQIEEENISEVLERFLDDPSPMVRQTALGQLGRVRERSLLPAVEKRLRDEEVSVRAAAIQAISFIGGSQQVDLIVPFLDDPEPTLRLQALHALSRFRAVSAAPRVAELLDDSNQGVRNTAANTLASLCSWRLAEMGVDPVAEAKKRWAERQAPAGAE